MAWDRWRTSSDGRGSFRSIRNNERARNPFTGGFADQGNRSDRTRRDWRSGKCDTGRDCGSGQACIDGECVKVYTKNGENFEPNSCGEDPVTWVKCKKGNEKAGSNDKCRRSTPGNCDKDPICPGEKCCRQQKDGSIRCICGPCSQTDWSSCNPWCDASYKTFGNIGAGCFKRDQEGFGECGGNICDECQSCSIHSKQCDGDTDDLPCHCSGCDEECHKCNTDTNSSEYGDCYYSEQDCAQCCVQYNYECPQCPNKYIPAGRRCQPVLNSKPCITALREELYRKCEQECKNEPDPCAPTGSFTFCEDGTPDYSLVTELSMSFVAEDVCPEGKVCENNGFIQVNGQTCWIISTWNEDEIPPECRDCDCNCHNDCRDCELCNLEGKCEKNPDCDNTLVNLVINYSETKTSDFVCFNNTGCGIETKGSGRVVLREGIRYEDAKRYSLVETDTGTVASISICSGCDSQTGACGQGNRRPCAVPLVYARLAFDGEAITGSGDYSIDISNCEYAGYCNITPTNPTEFVRQVRLDIEIP